MPKEIELKLEIAPRSVDALLASDLLAGACRDTALDATYFDTAKHELARHGHSLRIRNGDGVAVQTVKSGSAAAGLFSRGEWELPVAGTCPVADSRTPISDLLATRRGELLPLFGVAAQRRTCRVRHGEAEIEVAIDRAEIVAGERSVRFCEVELELLSGSATALFDFARKVDTIAPIRISVLAKAERGYRLLGPLPASVRAGTVPLDPAMDLTTAFAVIAADCLKQYRLNEAILLERYVPEAVHQARIGIRRLRSAMVLFRDLIAGPERDGINDRLRDLAQCLGDARDLDVLSARAEAGIVLERLSHAREAAHAAVKRKLRAKGTRLLMLDISAWIADGAGRHDAPAQPLQDYGAGALDRRLHKVAKHGRHLADLETEARHRFRKDAKKLRYAVEFLAPLFAAKRRRKSFGKALEQLQDALGGLNDQATARERLAGLGLVGTPEVEAFLARWATDHLLEDAADARRALLKVKPFWR